MQSLKPVLILSRQLTDAHADYVIGKFNRMGWPCLRFNADDAPDISNITFQANNRSSEILFTTRLGTFSQSDIGSVWFRGRDKVYINPAIKIKSDRKFAEFETKMLMRNWAMILSDHYWISDLDKIKAAHHKLYQQSIAQKLGFETPPTLVTKDPNEFLSFWEFCNQQVVQKPLGRLFDWGKGKDAYTFFTTKLDPEFLNQLESIRLAPCFFQKYISKKLELRITVVGEQVFAAALYSQEMEASSIDWRQGDIFKIRHEPYGLPSKLSTLCVRLVKKLGLRFGAIDMILTPEGKYVFLEINPNGQWLWIEHLTGLKISEALINNLISQGKTLQRKV